MSEGVITGEPIPVLVFSVDRAFYCVKAHDVDAVVAWRTTTPLPGASEAIHGVVQDKGRVVTVLHHPHAASELARGEQPLRVLVCPTPQGFVGLPATRTVGIESVDVVAGAENGSVVETSAGPATLLVVAEVARSIL